ncbi:MAG: DMT family transporter [Ignavibacteriales bacterium]|nr:DMT family transporter [Ignavibacteriales bacterium]
MKSERSLIVIGFIIISVIWGSTWLAIKIGLDSISPFYGIAIRFSIASIILFVILRIKHEQFPLDRDSIIMYLNLAVLSFSFPFALVYWGEQYIASGLASVLFGVYPFVVAIGSHLFLSTERLNRYKSSGIVLGFVGIVIIFWSDIHIGQSVTWGMAAILGSTVMQGTSLVILKRANHQISPTSLSLGGMVLSIIIMYPMAYIFEDYSTLIFDAKGIYSILYLGTFGTVVTFVVYYWLMKRVEVVYLSLVSFVTPVLAVILGTFWLKETFSPRIFIGASFVLMGILIANLKDLKLVFINRRNKIQIHD